MPRRYHSFLSFRVLSANTMSLGAGELKEIDAHLARIINLLERDRSLGISTATSVGPSPQPTNFISAPATDLLVTTESDSDSSSSHKFPTSTSEWVEYDPHTHKKIERKVSVDEYPDSDIDQLIAGIDITSIQGTYLSLVSDAY